MTSVSSRKHISTKAKSKKSINATQGKAQGLYQSVYKNLAEGIVWTDMDGLIAHVNPAVESLLGYSLPELETMHMHDILHPDYREEAMDAKARRIKGEKLAPHERVWIRKDGSVVSVEVWTTLLRDENGEPIGQLAGIRDLTWKKESAKALKTIDDRYRAVFEQLQEGILWAAPNGEIVDANPSLLRLSGYQLEELKGKRITDVIDPAHFQTSMEIKPVATVSNTTPIETGKLILKDGLTLPIEVRVTMIRDDSGDPEAIMVVLRDLTADLVAQEALRESEEQYRQLFNNTPVGFLAAEEGVISSANPEAARMLGIPAQELVGQPVIRFFPDTKDGKNRVQNTVHLFERGISDWDEDRQMLRADGSVFWARTRGHLISSAGEPRRTLGTFVDITSERASEEALRISQERYQVVFDHLQQGVVWAGVDGRITDANDAVQHLLGYTLEELRTKRVLDLTDPEFQAQAIANKAKLLHGEQLEPVTRVWLHKNGSKVVIELWGHLLLDENNEPTALMLVVTDLTARNEAQKALKESEERYRAVYSHLREAVLWADPDGKIIDANNAGLQMLGYTLSEIRTKAMKDIISPTFLERDRAVNRQILDGGTTNLRESAWLKKDGSAVNVEVWNTVIRSADGQPEALMGVATDVTERNQAQHALQESEERYRLLFENAPVGNITTVSRTITAANAEAAKIFGMDLNDLIGKDFLSLYAPTPDGYDNALATREAFNEIEGEWSDEFRMQRADGRMIWMRQSRRSVLTEYGVTENHGTFIDITREKEAEAALRRSEERYHAIYEELQEGIVQIGKQGGIIGANQAFANITGYAVDDLIGQSFAKLVEPGKQAEIPETIQRILAGEEFPPTEKLLVRKDDTRVPVEVSTTLLKDGLGEPEAIMVMVRDLRRQRETHQVNRELAVMEERTRFAREIHDTVAQTLTGLVSQLDAVTSMVSADQEQVHDQLLVARGLASSCLDQTRSALLDLKPSELRPGGLTDAIRAEIDVLNQRGLPVELKIHGIEPLTTNEDNAVAIYRIIQESLSNAFKHAQASEVNVDLIFGPDDAVVEIADDGVGFDSRAQRLRTNTSTTGFGLGVMHERADVAGGELTVISARGAGTRVIARIPYTISEAAIIEPPPQPIELAANTIADQTPCRVLLVDDHELVRRGTRALVEMSDDMIVVGEAATGDGALAIAQELEPDIILMDIHMPVKNGIEVTKELSVLMPQCKVILLTVYDDDDHVREGIRAGAKGYLIKGATKDEILNGIRTVNAGGSLLPASLVGRLADPQRSDLPDLSGREREVLSLLADGSSTKEIGEHLVLSLNTVNFHLRNLYQKLGVRSRTQAIKVGQQAGLLKVAKHTMSIS